MEVEQVLELEGGGVLRLERQGPRARFRAERPNDRKGLYKVWLRGDRGGKYLLGTLVPEGEKLRLSRELSVGELERAGCWPAFRGEAVLAFVFSGRGEGGWYCEPDPARLLADPLLKRQTRGALLCRREGDGFALSAPLRTDRPLPLEGLFCLARTERREGTLHLVWHFFEDGRPKPPNNNGKSG